jgi:hypothetical protein
MNLDPLVFFVADRFPGDLTVDHDARPRGAPWFRAKRHPQLHGWCLSVRLGETELTYYSPAAG